MEELLWQKTPLIRSSALSDKTGCEVYLKIETFQTSGSFKGRGVSHFANQALQAYLRNNGTNSYDTKTLAIEAAQGNIDERMEEWAKPTVASRTQPSLLVSHQLGEGNMSPSILPHLVIASGGNAGLAAASAARILGLQCTIFVPDAQANIVHMFERHGTNGSIKVRVGGVNYYEALTAARAFKDQLGERGILVPAYDDPLVWQGNSTLMHEIAQQLPEGVKPDAIFCSVGGGGLIAGLMLGCEMIPGWSKVPIVGVEPSGSACFYHSAQCSRNAANEANLPKGARSTPTVVRNPFEGFATPNGPKENGLRDSQPHVNGSKDSTVAVVHLGGIESRASSLGASSPSPDAVAMALRREGPVRCVTISDQRAMRSALEFVDDHFVVPELACSATLVPAYTPRLLERLVPRRAEGAYGEDGQRGKRVLVFVVCGGSKSSVRDLREFEAVLRDGPYAEEEDAIWVDGERV